MTITALDRHPFYFCIRVIGEILQKTGVILISYHLDERFSAHDLRYTSIVQGRTRTTVV